MYKVKVSTSFPWWPLARQTPAGDGIWGQCQFFINQDIDECDFWVVLDGLKKPESVKCPPQNTLLVTCEPPDFKRYDPNFVAQFATVLTCHSEIDHPNAILGQQGLAWMAGAQLDAETLTWKNFMTFQQLAASPPQKTKLLSVVVSKKTMVPGHTKRNQFLSRLQERLGDKIDIYGLGYNPIVDKWDAIAPYKYHLAIENSVVDHYWTEKLADAFLGESFPIYSGCPNVHHYFSPMSLEIINIDQTELAIDQIEKIIASNVYEDRRQDVMQSKHNVLYDYNILAVCEGLVRNRVKHSMGMKNITLITETDTQAGLSGKMLKRLSMVSDALKSTFS